MSNSSNILVVDDDKTNRYVLHDMIVDLGHIPLAAENGEAALAHMEKLPPHLVLLDIIMPKMDGYEVLDRMKGDIHLRHIPVIMISAVDEIEKVVRCVKKGADDYLTKPLNAILLKARIGACLEKYRLVKAELEFLDKTLRGSMKVLTDILSMLSPTAFGQASRVRRLVRRITKEMKIKKTWELDIAAMLSPLGYVTVPPKILEKLSAEIPLLPKEQEIFSNHPQIGHDLIANLPHLGKVAKIILHQNKHFDFDEEANTSCQTEIDVPFGVQVLRVAKDFDVFVSSGVQPAGALKRMRDKGKYYNRFIVDALAALVSEDQRQETRFLKIKELSAGMIFVENITTVSGQIICSKGTEINEFLLERMKNFSLEMKIIEPIKVVVPPVEGKEHV